MSRIAVVVEGISTVVSSNVVFYNKISEAFSFVGPVTNPLQDGVAFQLVNWSGIEVFIYLLLCGLFGWVSYCIHTEGKHFILQEIFGAF